MAVGETYRCALMFRLHGQLHVNTMYLKQEGAEQQETAEQVALHLVTRLAPIWQLPMGISGFSRLWQMDVTKVSRTLSEMGSASFVAPVAAGNEQALPTVNSVVISLRTGLQGPARRGRWFLGGVSAGVVDNSVLIPAGQARYSTFITQVGAELTAQVPASGFRLGVFSRKYWSILSNPFEEAWKPVTNLHVRSEITSMRSRKIGNGQ